MIAKKDKIIRYVDGPTMVIERTKDSINIGRCSFFYNLSDYRINHTTPILGYEFKDGIHYFETAHKIRTVPDEAVPDIVKKQIEELKEYLKSDIFKNWYKDYKFFHP